MIFHRFSSDSGKKPRSKSAHGQNKDQGGVSLPSVMRSKSAQDVMNVGPPPEAPTLAKRLQVRTNS